MSSGVRTLEDASLRAGNVMEKMTVGIVPMSPKKNAMREHVNLINSAARTTDVSPVAGSVTMTMTAEITLMKRLAHQGHVQKVNFLVPMDVVLLVVGSVMEIMIVSMDQMRKAVSYDVNKTSSSVQIATASHTAGDAMLMLTAWTEVMK